MVLVPADRYRNNIGGGYDLEGGLTSRSRERVELSVENISLDLRQFGSGSHVTAGAKFEGKMSPGRFGDLIVSRLIRNKTQKKGEVRL